MRLIDADELKELIDWTFAKPPFSRKTIKYMIDMARTVDAIPVEWIKRWSKEPMMEKDMKLAEQCEWNILEWLIADWQKRKEE